MGVDRSGRYFLEARPGRPEGTIANLHTLACAPPAVRMASVSPETFYNAGRLDRGSTGEAPLPKKRAQRCARWPLGLWTAGVQKIAPPVPVEDLAGLQRPVRDRQRPGRLAPGPAGSAPRRPRRSVRRCDVRMVHRSVAASLLVTWRISRACNAPYVIWSDRADFRTGFHLVQQNQLHGVHVDRHHRGRLPVTFHGG